MRHEITRRHEPASYGLDTRRDSSERSEPAAVVVTRRTPEPPRSAQGRRRTAMDSPGSSATQLPNAPATGPGTATAPNANGTTRGSPSPRCHSAGRELHAWSSDPIGALRTRPGPSLRRNIAATPGDTGGRTPPSGAIPRRPSPAPKRPPTTPRRLRRTSAQCAAPANRDRARRRANAAAQPPNTTTQKAETRGRYRRLLNNNRCGLARSLLPRTVGRSPHSFFFTNCRVRFSTGWRCLRV